MPTLDFSIPVIAHRGASAYAPENTMLAFSKAAQMGVKWIEFDVEQAACGEPVIFHDETLERTTNGRGLLMHKPYAFLRTLDAGAWFHPTHSGERIPTFKQVIEFVYQAKLSANVEIKPLRGMEAKLVNRVLAHLRQLEKTPSSTTLLYSSFSLEVLYRLRDAAPNVLIGLLLHEWEADWRSHCDELQCVSIHVNDQILTEDAAREIKNMGKQLLVYTVNDPMRAKELFSWGVDAVFSDVPDKISR